MRKAEKGTGVTEKKLGLGGMWLMSKQSKKKKICKCISKQEELYEGVH